jgi:hypothetical protein
MATRRNFDAAKRREWKAEARKERAMEVAHDQFVRINQLEANRNKPASINQKRTIIKWKMHEFCGHDDSYLETLTNGQADAIIKHYAAKNWNKKPKQIIHPQKPKKQPYVPAVSVFETQGKPTVDPNKMIFSKAPVRPKGDVTNSL